MKGQRKVPANHVRRSAMIKSNSGQTPGRPQGSPPLHSTSLALTTTTLPARIWCNCGAFAPYFSLRSLAGNGSPGGCKGDMVQLWRICAVFFWCCLLMLYKHVLLISNASPFAHDE